MPEQKPGLVRRLARAVKRRLRPQPNNPAASISADGTPRGQVLLSYVPEPFTSPDRDDLMHKHTHYWESWQIAESFRKQGFAVDVIHYNDTRFIPTKDYDILVSARINLEYLARHLPADCLKIAHLDTSHFLTNNANAYARLVDARERTGVSLRNLRMMEENWAIENADLGCVLGNDYTAGTYRFAGKPIHRIPISCTDEFDWPESRNFATARSRFMWFGSAGFVHKGLDLTLEAFRELPQHTLTVCGPMDSEKRFREAYHADLFEAENVVTPGWIDVTGKEFRDICAQSIATIYPSCAEGGGGSVITCMHAGLIPIVTEEASVDVGDFGVILPDARIATIRDAVASLSAMPLDELESRARMARDYARKHHTQARFAENYDEFVANIVMPQWSQRRGK